MKGQKSNLILVLSGYEAFCNVLDALNIKGFIGDVILIESNFSGKS